MSVLTSPDEFLRHFIAFCDPRKVVSLPASKSHDPPSGSWLLQPHPFFRSWFPFRECGAHPTDARMQKKNKVLNRTHFLNKMFQCKLSSNMFAVIKLRARSKFSFHTFQLCSTGGVYEISNKLWNLNNSDHSRIPQGIRYATFNFPYHTNEQGLSRNISNPRTSDLNVVSMLPLGLLLNVITNFHRREK